MLRRVPLVRTNVSKRVSASFIRVTRIGELGTLAVNLALLRCVHRLLVRASVVPSSPKFVSLMKEALNSSETSVLTRAIRRNISQGVILQQKRGQKLHFSKDTMELNQLDFLEGAPEKGFYEEDGVRCHNPQSRYPPCRGRHSSCHLLAWALLWQSSFGAVNTVTNKQTPFPLVRKLNIPTERLPFVGEI
jgi:hypothetical protein